MSEADAIKTKSLKCCCHVPFYKNGVIFDRILRLVISQLEKHLVKYKMPDKAWKDNTYNKQKEYRVLYLLTFRKNTYFSD